ncbi:Uncharacterized protein FWK35_00008983 [Aphis craccivora]|uniref:Uncharacterized protein n=1 Tax=Aphis craccivora TaxID=307492 RepID=A0A6G0ZPN1_APHCR|nr:Uncharacterized protein FWK35_00008983 [Aphis craccivora]
MCIILYGAVGQNTSHNGMRFGIQSVGTLSGRSSRINAATGTFDVGRRLTVSKDEVRQPALHSAPEEPGFARWLRCHNKQTAGPVFCGGTGKRLRAIENHRPRFTESRATVDVATTAIFNRKTSAGGSGDYTTPPPIDTSAERKIDPWSVSSHSSSSLYNIHALVKFFEMFSVIVEVRQHIFLLAISNFILNKVLTVVGLDKKAQRIALSLAALRRRLVTCHCVPSTLVATHEQSTQTIY